MKETKKLLEKEEVRKSLLEEKYKKPDQEEDSNPIEADPFEVAHNSDEE